MISSVVIFSLPYFLVKFRSYVLLQLIKRKKPFQFPFHFEEQGGLGLPCLLYWKRRVSSSAMTFVVISFSRSKASFSLSPSRALFFNQVGLLI